MANSLKFFKGDFSGLTTFVVGGVYFDNASHQIMIGNGTGTPEIFGGRVKDVVQSNGGMLTFSFNDGRSDITLDLSNCASASAVAAALEAVTDRVESLETIVGTTGTPAVPFASYTEYEEAMAVAGLVPVDEETYNQNPASFIKTPAQDASGLVKDVADIKDAIGGDGKNSIASRLDVLEGDENTPGSVAEAKKTADDAVEAAANAQSEIDALGGVVGNPTIDEVSHDATEQDVIDGKAENIGDKVVDVEAQSASGLFAEVEAAKTLADSKVSSVSAGDNSVSVSGSTAQPVIAVKISEAEGNSLSVKEDGLFATSGTDSYTLVKKETANEGAAATYQLQKNGEDVEGSFIDLANDMVISSGTVRKLTDDEVADGKGDADKDYIVLTLSNGDLLYIDAAGLVDSYTAGSGIVITSNEVSVKISEVEGNKLSVDEDGALQVIVNDSTTSKAIDVLGGPLADDAEDNWPAAWKDAEGNKQIPAGLTLEDILKGLFYQVKWGTLSEPTYSWSPILTSKPTAELDKDSYQIVGTKTVATFGTVDGVSNKKAAAKVNITNGYGYSTDGSTITEGPSVSFQSTDGEVSGELTATGTWNGTEITSGDEVEIVEGTNTLSVSQSGYSITPGTFSDGVVYNVSNAKDIDTNAKKEINQAGFEASSAYSSSKTLAAKTAEAKVTGYYPYYCGLINENVTSDSYFTEAIVKQNASRTIPTSMTTAADTNCYFVAVPEGSTNFLKSQLFITNAKETDQFGVALPSASTIEITVAGTATKNYKVFYASNAAAWGQAQTFDKFTWK